MTSFALSFWLFRETGEATTLTWAIFFFITPGVLLSPVAGAIIDRANRKTVLIASDLTGLDAVLLRDRLLHLISALLPWGPTDRKCYRLDATGINDTLDALARFLK